MSEQTPNFRFAQMRTDRTEPLMSTQSVAKAASAPEIHNVIDKSEFAAGKGTSEEEAQTSLVKASKSNFLPTSLRPVPAFYPLEKSTRLVEDQEASEIAARISECLRSLSVQAFYNNETATASLITSENVEMHLALWRAHAQLESQGILVELQRRKGDSIVFHRYSRSILDAAVGDIDVSNLPYDLQDALYSKRAQRLLSAELDNEEKTEHENAVIALEISHGLLMKDRMDARQLGLESLCLLTDPRKTGHVTAMLASHAVLLGSTRGVEILGVPADEELMLDEGPFQEIREAILSLVQFSRIGEDEVDESDVVMSPDSEQMTLLHNLALAVLANALDNIENPERFETEPEDSKPSSRGRLRTASSTDVANEFLQQTEDVTSRDVLKTLISELGKAQQKPHNAALSAKCLGSLCRASDEARRRAKELGAKNVVSTALDVGVRTHLKLEKEARAVVRVLERPDQD